jgi:glycine/D-amino acid oxidase-like deaminating enzyme
VTQYRATRTPIHRGPAGWEAILGPRTAGPRLDNSMTADFVIVGGGFAGLSAARRLIELDPKSRIVVLEAGQIAQSTAGRNSGFMIDLPHDLASDDYAGAGDDRTVTALNRHAQSFASGAVDDYGIDPNFFDRAGKINGAASPAAHGHNETYAKHLASLGEASEMLDADAMRDITGSAHYLSGLYTPGTVMLQPAGYIRGLADGLRRDGVQIFENSAVFGFLRQANAWQVTTEHGALSAGKVILCVNGHLESFGIARGTLMHLFLFATMTPELDAEALAKLGGRSRWGITPSDPMGTTMRRIDTGQGGNRIITRTCAALRSGMVATPADVTRAAAVMQRKFDSRFPQLAGMKMQYTWAGHLCMTDNVVSVTRQIDDGVFSACVQNGLGTARGTLTGLAAAEMAMGHTSDATRFFAQEPAPKRIAPQPVRDIGANLFLRWREWRARED